MTEELSTNRRETVTEGLATNRDTSDMSTLQAFNCLAETLEKMSIDLRQTRNQLFNLSEKLATDWLDQYWNQMEKYGQYIAHESIRFKQNQTMADKWRPVVDQLVKATNWAKDQNLKIEKQVRLQRNLIRSDCIDEFEPILFDHSLAPELPDLWPIYMSIIDEIPIEFFADSLSAKTVAKEFIEWKRNIALAQNSPKSGVDCLNSKQEISPISESKTVSNDMLTKVGVEEAVVIKKESLEPIDIESISDVSKPEDSISNNGSVKEAEEVLSEIESKPYSTFRPPFRAHPFKKGLKTFPKPRLSVSFDSKLDFINSEIQPKTKQSIDKNLMQLSENRLEYSSGKGNKIAKLNDSPLKLMARLRAKYPNVSEEFLTNAINKTKQLLISSGALKGFSGLKMSEIIGKVSEYLDKTPN